MLNRWDPFAEIARLHDEMFRMSGNREDGKQPPFATGFTPPVDIVEQKDAILVMVELPGLKAEDVQVSVENDVLTLTGERKFDGASPSKDGFLRVERAYGKFTRSFSLPKTVQGEGIDADMQDGVLVVRVPKRAAPQPKRIDVRSGGAAQPVRAEKAS